MPRHRCNFFKSLKVGIKLMLVPEITQQWMDLNSIKQTMGMVQEHQLCHVIMDMIPKFKSQFRLLSQVYVSYAFIGSVDPRDNSPHGQNLLTKERAKPFNHLHRASQSVLTHLKLPKQLSTPSPLLFFCTPSPLLFFCLHF